MTNSESLPPTPHDAFTKNEPVAVLLVEDNEHDFFFTKMLFEELPEGAYRLDRVADFQSAVNAFEQGCHALYLVDYHLGRYTGLDLLSEAMKRGCTAPIIMLTGHREREMDLQAMLAGAVDYLVKDQLDALTLERSMRYAIQHQRQAEEIRLANQQLEERVRQRTMELARVNEMLQGEIVERLRAERALREADRRKDHFLATLAHELRNPLSPLTSATQLLLLDPRNESQVKELGEILQRQIRHLTRLIDDLLDVSRISSGKLNLRCESLILSEAIDAAIDVCRPLLEEASHAFELEMPSEPLVVFGDKVRLAQVVGNLLVNAAKYTPPGGRIAVQVVSDGLHAVIHVRDNGIGIAGEMLPEIFGLFTQVDSSATRTQGGLGIGLTLVRTLVEMHGGTVEAKSAGPRLGSEFTVRIPLVQPQAAAECLTASRPTAEASLPKFRILVVDDNQSAAHLLRRLLEKLEQQVLVADSAQGAMAAIPDYKPELVISDIAMPGESGYQLAAAIRKRSDWTQPILIALTGYGRDDDRRDALAAGFNEHLVKPIGLPEVKTLLRSIDREAGFLRKTK